MTEAVLPMVARSLERDRLARQRQARLGILPPDRLNKEADRVGHGSVARYRRHLKDGESPCVSCSEANARMEYGYPAGLPDFAEDQWGAL